ncbi:MAG: Ig-like domain-containing protein, partial [Paramuribaculum sp.]|nr:Ig-like domain-containing protein [Paramuribaculum sp.]
VVEFDDSEIKSQVWTSSNPAVASVDVTGKVTGVGNGPATITFTATNNNNKSDSEDCLITVTPDAAVISIEADETNSINFDRQYLVYDLYGKIISDSIHNVLPGLYIVRQGGKAVKIIVK